MIPNTGWIDQRLFFGNLVEGEMIVEAEEIDQFAGRIDFGLELRLELCLQIGRGLLGSCRSIQLSSQFFGLSAIICRTRRICK